MNDAIPRRLRDRLFVVTAALSFGCAGARGAGALPRCDNVRPPTKSTLVARYYATGVQIYRWGDTAWTFVAPDAVLSSDAGGKHKVGTHYAGPTWEVVGDGKVVGAVAQRCTPNATAIPWLLLTAAPGERSGIFTHVTFIQRVHTTGGLAPSTRGNLRGAEVRVPYSAEYLFYRIE